MQDVAPMQSETVSCRTSSYTIQQLMKMGLPVEHIAEDTGHTLEELQQPTRFISWEAYLKFFENAQRGVSDEQFISLCTSYNSSPFLRPILMAAGLWFDPERYLDWIAGPNGAIQQLFRCLETRCERVAPRKVMVEERLKPGYVIPPDRFWEAQAIGFSVITKYFGLSPSIVTWEPLERGVAFHIQLPRRRPLRTLLSKIFSWFRQETADDLRMALIYGHERSLRLEKEATTRKQAESAIREEQQKLLRISNAIPGIVYQFVLEPDGTQKFTFISEGATTLTGFTPEELMADIEIVWQNILPEFVPDIQASIIESAQKGTPWHQEFQFRIKSGEIRWVRGHSVPEPPDPQGRIVWHGILTDITAERKANEALRERDELLRKLSQQVPGGIYQYRQWPDGRDSLLYYSHGLMEIYEVTADEVGDSVTPLLNRIHPDDLGKVMASVERATERLEEWICEYRIQLPSRGERWLEGHAMPERLPDGSTLWHGYVNDITERKRIEQAQREVETRFRRMVENIPGVIFRYGLKLDGTDYMEDISPGCRNIWEVEPDQVTSNVGILWEMVHPQDLEPMKQSIWVSAQDLTPWIYDWRITTPSGKQKYLRGYGRPERVKDGSVVWNTAIFDVSAQKQTEIALRESEERFRTLFENSPDAIFLVDQTGRIRSANSAAVRMHGWTQEELLSRHIQDLDTPESAKLAKERIQRLLSGETLTFEVEHWRKDGSKFPVEVQATVVEIAGEKLLLSFDRDITARKQAETALRVSEYRRRLALDTVQMGMWDWDIESDLGVWDERQHELFGFAVGEFDGRPETFYNRIHPADVSLIKQQLEHTIATGEDYEAEFRAYPKPGVMRWMFGRGRLIRNAEGKPIRIIGINYDRTKEKQALLALKEAEQRQRLALDAGRMGTWDWEIGTDRLDWDEQQQQLYGFQPGEFDRRLTTFMSRVHPDDHPAVRQVLENAEKGIDFDGEFRIIWPNGEVRWIHGSGIVYPSNGERAARLIGINYDVTDRIQAQQQLQEANSLLKSLTQIQQDFIVATDPQDSLEGLLKVILRKTNSEYGFLGQVLLDSSGQKYLKTDIFLTLSSDESKRRFFEEISPTGSVFTNPNSLLGMVFTTGQPVISNNPNTDPRRGELPPNHPPLNSFLGVPLFRGSELIGMVGLANRPQGYDETVLNSLAPILSTYASLLEAFRLRNQQELAEKALRSSLTEKEAMLKEIHHRVKNNLQVISSLLNLQAERLTDPLVREIFLESQSRVRAMALVHETLYGSDSLAQIDLPLYIQRLCDSLLQTFGGKGRVIVDRQIAPVSLDLDRSLPVGLIISELVSNALKYAFPNGRQGRIQVTLLERDDKNLELSVSDDGVGLPADLDLDNTHSLGIYLVRVLTRQLRGNLLIESNGAGATFTLSIPK